MTRNVVHQFEVTDAWRSMVIGFDEFEGDSASPGASTNGDGITGIVQSSQLCDVRGPRGNREPTQGLRNQH